MAIALRRRSLLRIAFFLGVIAIIRLFVGSSSSSASVTSFYGSDPQQIQKQGVLDLVTRGEKPLDARKHTFLQVRMGRDERPDMFSDAIDDGIADYWERFQKPLYVECFTYAQPATDPRAASLGATPRTWTRNPC